MKVTSGKAQLAVVTAGTGTPIVFLHAGVADWRMWRAQIETFSRTHKTIAYDRRGYGETTYSEEPHDILADLAAVLDATAKGEQVVLVGCSMGGRLAADFTVSHLDRVKGVVLVGAGISGAPEPALDTFSRTIRKLFGEVEAAEKLGDKDRVNALEAHAWLDGAEQTEGRVSGDKRDLFLDMNGKALRAAPAGKNTSTVKAYDRIGELKMPVLFIIGEYDFSDINDTSRHLATVAPNAKLVALKSAHLPSLEEPEAFNAALLAFLTDNKL